MKRRLARWLKRLVLAGLVLVVLSAIAVFFVLRSQWLREEARTRIIAATEKATGGKVELKKFDFNPRTLQFEVRDFILRGKEAAGDPPMVHVEHVVVGVTVVSLWQKQAYLASLDVTKPRVRIVTYPDGTTNIPGPKVRTQGKSVFERFVDLAVRKMVVKDGWFEYDNRRIPINLVAENFSLAFAWDGAQRRYEGTVKAQPFLFDWEKFAPLEFDATVDVAMERGGLQIEKATVTRGKSTMHATGTMVDYRTPKFELEVDGEFPMAEWVKETRLPLSPEGHTSMKGHFRYHDGFYELTGRVNGRGLAVRQKTWNVTQIAAVTDFTLVRDLVTFPNVEARTLGGVFRGGGEIRNWNAYRVKGTVDRLSLAQLQTIERQQRDLAWSAEVSGPVEVAGSFNRSDLQVKAAVALTPAEGKIPVEGVIRTQWEQARNAISFENSFVKAPHTRVDFNGAMGSQIQVALDTTDLNDALPALALLMDKPPEQLPVALANPGGRAHFEGQVTSPLDKPTIAGRAVVEQALVEGRQVDRASGQVEVDSSRLVVKDVAVRENGAEVTGSASLSLANWRLTGQSQVDSQLVIKQTPLEKLLEVAGRKDLPVQGLLSGAVEISGTIDAPQILAQPTLVKAVVSGEPFERIAGTVRVVPGKITVQDGVVDHASGRIPFTGEYEHPDKVYERGIMRVRANVLGLQLNQIATLRKQQPDLSGLADVNLTAEAKIEPGRAPAIETLDAQVGLRRLTMRKQVLGALELTAGTKLGRVTVDAQGNLLGSPIRGNGEWQLSGDANGLGTLELGTLTLARLNEVLRNVGVMERELPLDGRFESEIVFSGALRKPSTLKARVNISQVELYPRSEAAELPAVLEDLKLRNNGPIIVLLDETGMQITQAQLTGKDTNLEASGTLSLNTRNAWNLMLRGGLNLAILQDSMAGLKTSGTAAINATVRGTLAKPLLGGRMEVQNATFAHRDLTNSLDKANGLVLFDRNRALIENFTAQTGGGEVKLGGFVTFGGEEQITYRVNGQLDRVRIRYPEGASTTVNANLSLTGTSDQSLVSGLVTVLRSGFSPRTDFGNMLFESKRVQTPTASPLLRGMQFDVRVVNAPSLQLETSLTQGLEAEVDMRLRGSPSKPIVLGTVAVTQGDLNFFGTTYTILRGTVSFFNAARIEPILDLDLETVVRAVTVNMNITGSVDRPNITYRSDPPLQTQEIVALLAVGRTPAGSTIAPQANIGNANNGLFAGGDTLLGQALSAGVSGRLQRFFGVSRVKIDPQLIGLETTPQARLTIEQQISRDITLTYVTNLTGTLQQLVRLQWDFKRNWSVTMVRDENGVVGSDVQFRKRFK
jgi:translocation and assembly module TamB